MYLIITLHAGVVESVERCDTIEIAQETFDRARSIIEEGLREVYKGRPDLGVFDVELKQSKESFNTYLDFILDPEYDIVIWDLEANEAIQLNVH